MTALLTIAMLLIGLALLCAVAVLLVQLVASSLPQKPVGPQMARTTTTSYVVLMPAHDESEIIETTATKTMGGTDAARPLAGDRR